MILMSCTTPLSSGAHSMELFRALGTVGHLIIHPSKMQEMFNKYMRDMMGIAPEVVGIGAMVQPPKMDFAKLMRDFTNMGGNNFNDIVSVIGVQEWLVTCDEIFKELKLKMPQKKD